MTTAADAINLLRADFTGCNDVRLIHVGTRRTQRVTAERLSSSIDQAVSRLASLDIARGTTVLFAIRPSVTAVVYLAALITTGACTILTDLRQPPDLLQARLKEFPADLVLTDPILAFLAAGLIGRLTRGRTRIPALDSLAPRLVTVGRRTGASRRQESPELDAPALIVFTSGTTAEPRAVLHTQHSLGAMLETALAMIEEGGDETVYTDQFHSLFPALAAGARCVFGSAMVKDDQLAARLIDHGVTTWFTTPTRARAVAPLIAKSVVRRVVLGSAPVTASLLSALAESLPDVEVVAVYAMTEAVPIALTTGKEILAYEGNGDLVGSPVEGISVTIDDTNEIAISGARVGRHGTDPNTMIRTGDLGHFTPDGRLVLDGRTKDMIIVGGENIYPQHFEEAIASISGVVAAGLVGVADMYGDEKLWLAVQSQPDVDQKLILSAIHRSPHGASLPLSGVVFVDLPYAGRSKKLDRKALRQVVINAVDHK